MAEVPKQIAELIAKFYQNLDAYHTAAYGETEVRVEFINPLFEALGWDIQSGNVPHVPPFVRYPLT